MESTYDLDIPAAIAKIKDKNAKRVCIQLPDGLKPYAQEIQDALEKETDAEIFIWAGSCYGACDTPVEVKNLGVDLLIQWGHSPWR